MEHFGSISCKSGKVFSITREPNDTEWLMEATYYQFQGCQPKVSREQPKFEYCDCDHCKIIIHEFNGK